MEITKTITINIDLDTIIEDGELSKNSTDSDIDHVIYEYVTGLDDCDYYLIDDSDEDEIAQAVRTRLGK